jgi:crossover junction endodeoxyribonuclease RusA
MIELTCEYPPSANRLFRAVPGRGVIKSKVYRDWLEINLGIIRGQLNNKITGQYVVVFEATRPDKRKRDIDNLIKPLMDLIVQAGAVEDDSLCAELTAKWVNNGNGIRIFIREAQSPTGEVLSLSANRASEATREAA